MQYNFLPTQSKFISEKEIEEKKAKAGNKDTDDLPYDPRPLHEILRERQLKKDDEMREMMKASNMAPKALDADEIEFLNEIETKQKQEKRLREEITSEQISEFLKLQQNLISEENSPVTLPKEIVSKSKDEVAPKIKKKKKNSKKIKNCAFVVDEEDEDNEEKDDTHLHTTDEADSKPTDHKK